MRRCIVENLPNVEKEVATQVQEAQRVPYRIYPRRNMPRHIIIKLTQRTNMKSRDIILPTKVHLVKAMVLPVVMYGYESWTTKKAEH